MGDIGLGEGQHYHSVPDQPLLRSEDAMEAFRECVAGKALEEALANRQAVQALRFAANM